MLMDLVDIEKIYPGDLDPHDSISRPHSPRTKNLMNCTQTRVPDGVEQGKERREMGAEKGF